MSFDSITTSIDDAVSDFFDPVATAVGDIVFYTVPVAGTDLPLIVAWLAIAGLVFTGWFGLIQARKLKLALEIVRGKYDEDGSPGEVNHFQALTAAVSGTVGLGNIAGVAVAVSIGGAGATFWMILCGLLGMASKFVEVTLGVKYREEHPDGTVSGGPMHYLPKGLAERFGSGGAKLGKVLAVLASVFILFFGLFGGNLFQTNQSYAQISSTFGGDDDGFMASSAGAVLFGLVVAVLVGLVLLGGIRSIANVTSRLVPAMAIMYVLACLTVILVNVTAVPDAIASVIDGAFDPEGVAGGVIGALIVGFQRAAFSNEAGIGSAPIAHSAVKTKHPASEGLVALLEPFIDTVVICTMTALTIVIANPASWGEARQGESIGGVTITSDAFATVLPWFPHLLTVAVLLFAFSTILTWGYYGLKAWTYLFGRSRTSETLFKSVWSLFVVAGALLSLDSLISLADSALFLLAVVNIIGLYLLAPVVKRELNSFLEFVRSRKDGESADTGPGTDEPETAKAL
ncbi:alanine/glycine:cation symporter family protein [Streptomyces prasinus]